MFSLKSLQGELQVAKVVRFWLRNDLHAALLLNGILRLFWTFSKDLMWRKHVHLFTWSVSLCLFSLSLL